MVIDLPQWALNELDKLRRGYLWRGRKEVRGEHCLVAWGKVTRPTELRGLGISDIKNLSWALRVRWLWLHKTDPHRPWSMFQIQVPEQVRSFFSTAMASEVGDGTHTLFWEDRWLHGQRVIDIAPRLHAVVDRKVVKKHTVRKRSLSTCGFRMHGQLTQLGHWVSFYPLGQVAVFCVAA
ncbi:hypothetical protein PR202_gb11881 [Eleusine coracana subsp. coracana]|uniref:Uncharacterized protein n=1 Tax=Eleusine coracana subsp. coracana TaxID=191504 RepID=A0AAV5EP40_ELECO|nr:hypothetical protein PR202_gb11881 [Eleusine coracana subsp. coracana]